MPAQNGILSSDATIAKAGRNEQLRHLDAVPHVTVTADELFAAAGEPPSNEGSGQLVEESYPCLRYAVKPP